MAYQIVRGWPSAGALDEPLKAADGVEVVPGSIATLDSTGKAIPAVYAADGSNAGDLAFFVIDNDALANSLVGLKSGMIIECDADHYVAGAYEVNQPLTATDGKFAPVTASEKEVAKVRSFDATTGQMRVIWTAIG
jgi:hypothetical protein